MHIFELHSNDNGDISSHHFKDFCFHFEVKCVIFG